MNDTRAEMSEEMRQKILAMTPEERLLMGCAMNEAYRLQLIQGILQENPSISKLGLKKELFLKLFRYSPEERQRILEQFDRTFVDSDVKE